MSLLPPDATDASLTAAIADPVLATPGRAWWISFMAAAVVTLLFGATLARLLGEGLGTLGNNASVVWGVPIAGYVWWIGIGNAGTLISALLLLTRQGWRAAISRFAEAMTLFALVIAGLFPIIHLGRPMYFYWLAPYPNTMDLYPQWRSALVWDFWSIVSYLLFSILFWYLGLIPDLATLRDRAQGLRRRRFYGAFALGWRGSARQWRLHDRLTGAMAGLAVPLVCSVHSIVGLDFAASLMPGWAETIFPPYFVVGAMFSGFAMVTLLAALLRRGLGLQTLIGERHFEAIARILLASSLFMTLSYATEWFSAWCSGNAAERGVTAFSFTGVYAPLFWAQLACNCLAPQILWWPRARRSLFVLLAVCVGVLIGMWLERILIIWNTLTHGFLPSTRVTFKLSFEDGLLLLTPFGLFAALFLLFVRLAPAVSMSEMRSLRAEETP